ncbi:hypothetical protein MOV61_02940 [Neorhizobium sp. BETTINA12A]|uniref:hypothetical protein n=1 Tax=Neorhizobium sp. BETTINA12A TaxID=2908924 RepID=UPI001FF419E2|nr:hypothetical protein [Neorhizobium sp. BETTINA12A]MCJ9749672.1 hypothetical protein [Neorhizobium sp. BETTINA12A]
MIDNLTVSKSAAFFTVRRNLTDKTVEDLFTALRKSHGTSANNVFRHIRESQGNARWSAICFEYSTSPAFLNPASGVKERLFGYLMLVEYQGHAALFSSRLVLPTAFKSRHFSPISVSRMEGAIARENAVFQKMRMRNMSVSPHVMRNKTLEAPNLANVVGPAGSRRYAPQTYTVSVDGIYSTTTPSTGRIGVRSDKVGHDELIEFARIMIDALRVDPVDVSPFIRTFARPMSLEDALAASQPTTIAIDTARLAAAVTGDEATIRLVHVGDHVTELSTDEFSELLGQLDQALSIEGNGKLRAAKLPDSDDEVATISLNKSRIALRSLTLGMAAAVEVETCDLALGEDPDRRPLRSYLDEGDCFIVLFDDVRLSYIDGQVFRDETMLDGGASFLPYLHPDASLQTVTDEKGTFVAGQVAFDGTSTFGAIVEHIGAEDAILICDDLGDEWADFIGIKEEAGFVQVCFYHAKHDALTLSAGSFHVAVSQAIKNLGNMMFPPERMAAKMQSWNVTYNAAGQPTQIARIIRNNMGDLGATIVRARTAPDVRRRAVIVTSSLSKKGVEDAFAAIQAGQRPPHTFVQLFWLLQSFFSACTEVGASGSIVCQP